MVVIATINRVGTELKKQVIGCVLKYYGKNAYE
jgi:hypothetical protein